MKLLIEKTEEVDDMKQKTDFKDEVIHI